MSRKDQITKDVELHGWSVFKIVDKELPPFAYTVGLYSTYNHPEIIMSGLSIDILHQLLNDIGIGVKNGLVRQPDARYDDLLEGFDCIFKKVNLSVYDDFLGQALVFYDEKKVPFLQCVYPDDNGFFAWDANSLPLKQEILY